MINLGYVALRLDPTLHIDHEKLAGGLIHRRSNRRTAHPKPPPARCETP
jgi:hypothetical protein